MFTSFLVPAYLFVQAAEPLAGNAHPCLLSAAHVCFLTVAPCSLSIPVYPCLSLSSLCLLCLLPAHPHLLRLRAPYLFLLIPARFLLIVASSLPIHGCSLSAAALLTSSPLASTCFLPDLPVPAWSLSIGTCSVPLTAGPLPRSDTCWPPMAPAEPGTGCSRPLSLPGGKGLHSLLVFVRAGHHWRTEKLAVRAGGVPRAGCWHGNGKGMPEEMSGGCRGLPPCFQRELPY